MGIKGVPDTKNYWPQKKKINQSVAFKFFFFFFSNYLILPAAIGPGVYSVSNRNEYQKEENNVSGE
jgi:hypothetical protein